MAKSAQGSIKTRKAALDAAAWMNQKPYPIPVFRKGEAVEIYRGAGWSKATVINSTAKGCSVKIWQNDQLTNIYDARCIRPTTKE
jgi:hypothetical protein